MACINIVAVGGSGHNNAGGNHCVEEEDGGGGYVVEDGESEGQREMRRYHKEAAKRIGMAAETSGDYLAVDLVKGANVDRAFLQQMQKRMLVDRRC